MIDDGAQRFLCADASADVVPKQEVANLSALTPRIDHQPCQGSDNDEDTKDIERKME